MSLRTTKENLGGSCPVCEEVTFLPEGVEESEILTCHDCQSQLVVVSIDNLAVTLEEAPVMEEDWGE